MSISKSVPDTYHALTGRNSLVGASDAKLSKEVLSFFVMMNILASFTLCPRHCNKFVRYRHFKRDPYLLAAAAADLFGTPILFQQENYDNLLLNCQLNYLELHGMTLSGRLVRLLVPIVMLPCITFTLAANGRLRTTHILGGYPVPRVVKLALHFNGRPFLKRKMCVSHDAYPPCLKS